MKQRALREWLRFFRSESHILTHNPALLFQQAANQPATTAPAAAALERSRRFASRRWVRWVNRPAHLSPCLLTIPARRGNYLSCDWSPDGRYLLAGSSFSRLTLFDAESGTEVWEIEPFGREVKQCGFSPDGRIVVTIVTSSLLFWEPHTGDPLAGHHQYHPEYSIVSWAFTPDSATLVTGCSDGTLRLWDTSSAEEYRVIDLAGHSSLSSSYNAVEACAVTPDGSRIVAVTPRSIAVVALESATIERYPGGGSEVAGVALLPGDRVLIGERYRGGTRVRSYTGSAGDPDDSDPPLFEIPWLACCAVSPDGKRLLAGCGGSLELWDLDSRRRLAAHSGGGGSIDACWYSPDGARFVSAATVLRTWDSEDFLAAEPAPAAARAIGWARMAPDGKRVVTVGLERIVKLWDAASGAEVPWPGDPAESVSDGRFSADGRRLVAPAGDGTIKLWDLTTGRLLLTLPAQDKRLVDCVLSPDESRILAKTPGESLLLYEARGGRLLLETYGGVGDADLARAFSPDGRRFVMAWAGKLELRDSETG
ncbi:MAG: WD40 repeat domain-containing protein, partial [Gemmatimonadales bacterium]